MAGHATEEHPHGADRLCAAGDRVYSRAVRRGRVPRADADPVPLLNLDPAASREQVINSGIY